MGEAQFAQNFALGATEAPQFGQAEDCATFVSA
jgi:hypothetical protein